MTAWPCTQEACQGVALGALHKLEFCSTTGLLLCWLQC